MGAPLLQLVQDALDEQGLTSNRPVSIIKGTDNLTRQMLALALQVGRKVLLKGRWPQLSRQWLIQTPFAAYATGTLTQGSLGVTVDAMPPQVVAGSWTVRGGGAATTARVLEIHTDGSFLMDQPALASGDAALTFAQDTFQLPDDVDMVTDRTGWDRGKRWELIGPMTAQEDQAAQSGLVTSQPWYRYRIAGFPAQLILRPPSTTQDELVFEYYGKNWIIDAETGAFKDAFTSDTDTCVWRDDIMVSGLIYLFRRAKGFEYGAFKSDFDKACSLAMARATPGRIMNLSGRRCGPRMLDYSNVPDGNWPGRQ